MARPKGTIPGARALLDWWNLLSGEQATALPEGAILRLAEVLGVAHQYLSHTQKEGVMISEKQFNKCKGVIEAYGQNQAKL